RIKCVAAYTSEQSPHRVFDALVAALPISVSGEEAQLKRISELQAENDAIGQELQKQLEAAGLCPVFCFSLKSELLS
ncbi:Mediator of RNA polymerase II transcription subunit 21, partial [Glycine soja]